MVICQNFAPVYAPNIDQSPGILGPQFMAAIHNLLKLCEQSSFVLLTMLTWPTTGAASGGEGGIMFLLSLVIRGWYVYIYCWFALVKCFQSCLEGAGAKSRARLFYEEERRRPCNSFSSETLFFTDFHVMNFCLKVFRGKPFYFLHILCHYDHRTFLNSYMHSIGNPWRIDWDFGILCWLPYSYTRHFESSFRLTIYE